MNILFDSKSPLHKRPFGCLKENESCHISILIPKDVNAVRVFLILEKEDGLLIRIPLIKKREIGDYFPFTADFSLFQKGLYHYFFKIEKEEGEEFFLYKRDKYDTNIGEGEKWQLSCIDKDFKTPDFFKGVVFYQIFPDRFYKEKVIKSDDKLPPYFVHENEADVPVFMPDENGKITNSDFFGGNLKGIEKKLNYLKGLGVGAIYLNPIFSAYSNHRYDTSDYMKIDPMLGDEKDFVSLCAKAKKLGIKIILDGVFSHTGADSIYFDKLGRYEGGAFNDEVSPYRDWYSFNEDGTYSSWWGIDTLPQVNEMNPSYLAYIKKVLSHWLILGADGFRLDVADELPDEFIREVRRTIKETKKDALLIGEVWEDASNKVSYGKRREYLLGEELDSVMNYPQKDFIIAFVKGEMSSGDLSYRMMTLAENYPSEVLHTLLNSLSTHDTERILTHLSPSERPESREERAYSSLLENDFNIALDREKMAAFLQFTLPGAPCIYYGDEAGLEGYEDPFNILFFPLEGENAELTNLYKKLASIKNENAPLKFGDIEFIAEGDEIIHFKRTYKGEALYFVLCRNSDFQILGGKIIFSEKCENNMVAPYGFAVYKKED